MRFVTKKTTDLSKVEKQGLVELFNVVFDRRRTIEEFDRQFLNNPEGYSYHTYAEEDGIIVASNTMVPSIYLVNGKPYRFVNSVDTMIEEHHRGLENFYDMIKTSFGDAETAGYDVVYGFPNDNSYELFTKLKFMKDIGKLDTYCLPYRIGGVKKGLGWLNWVSMAVCRLWVQLSFYFASSKRASYIFEKEADSFNATRYNRSDGNYSVVDGLFAYKVINYEGVRTAFVIDVFEKSARNFVSSIKYLLKKESANFDLILYVGHLTFGSCGFLKFPRKFEPKHFNFTGLILKKGVIDKGLFYEIDNWDINLSNYDVI